MTTATYPDSSENITYIYDTGTNGLGRLASVTDEAGSTSFTYDHRGNVLSETKVIGTASYPITYTYDLADRRLSLAYHYPRIIRYSRDSIGRVVSMSLEDSPGVNVQTIANSFAYLPFGIASGWDQANGSLVARTFDLDYRLTEAKMTSSASAAIYSRLYAYDLRNDIISITNVIDSTRNQSFTYDALQRLTQGVGVYGSRDYAYDEVGNRVEKTTDSTIVETLSYSGNNNRLQTASESSTTRTMQCDLAGNLTFDDRGLDPDLTFTYNNRNRLAAASSTAMSATYKYNAFGQRVSKTVDGQTRHFLYDLSGRMIAEVMVSTGDILTYLYVNGEMLALLDEANDAGFFVQNDHLGTPQQMTDMADQVVWFRDYQPFGNRAADEPNFAFPGQYADSETGLSYNYFRTYDPSIGRYTQSDPIGLRGGLNTYSYAYGSPLRYSDFYGLDPWTWDGAGNTQICAYYDQLAEQNPQCGYFQEAADICRGGSFPVNALTNAAIVDGWVSGSTSNSQSEIFNGLRNNLVEYDRAARANGSIDRNGCTCGDDIDSYHNDAFANQGLPAFYGGNIWPQNTPPNPVPYDSRGSNPVDDFVNDPGSIPHRYP